MPLLSLSAQQQLAESLMHIGAIMVSADAPFTFSSGIRSPIYCDLRMTMAHPRLREVVVEAFAQLLVDHKPDAIVGTATAGIAHAAWLSQHLQLPMAYVRSKPKAHGRQQAIEGDLKAGQSVVLIEDLISTGGSVIEAACALKAAKIHVEAVMSIFSYGMTSAQAHFEAQGHQPQSLLTLDVLLDLLKASSKIDDQALTSIRAWQRDPLSWMSGDNE